jgi:hypothetical protein
MPARTSVLSDSRPTGYMCLHNDLDNLLFDIRLSFGLFFIDV